MSVKKWERILKELVGGVKTKEAFELECGFCKELTNDTRGCGMCYLGGCMERGRLYADIKINIGKYNYGLAIEGCREMLLKIREAEKYIYDDKPKIDVSKLRKVKKDEMFVSKRVIDKDYGGGVVTGGRGFWLMKYDKPNNRGTEERNVTWNLDKNCWGCDPIYEEPYSIKHARIGDLVEVLNSFCSIRKGEKAIVIKAYHSNMLNKDCISGKCLDEAVDRHYHTFSSYIEEFRLLARNYKEPEKEYKISYANWLLSVNKWEDSLKIGNESALSCGFCAEYKKEHPEDGDERCEICPLFDKYCSNKPNGNKIYWKITHGNSNLIPKMLEKIKDCYKYVYDKPSYYGNMATIEDVLGHEEPGSLKEVTREEFDRTRFNTMPTVSPEQELVANMVLLKEQVKPIVKEVIKEECFQSTMLFDDLKKFIKKVIEEESWFKKLIKRRK